MIPVILDETKALQDLSEDVSNGLGRLSDAVSVSVLEERNGAYTLSIVYPADGAHFSDIHIGGVIKAKPNETDPDQLFRIKKITKPMNGKCTIEANHISYDLSKTSVKPFSAVGASATCTALMANMIGGDAFNIFSDSENTTSKFTNKIPQSARSLFGGQSGSFLDVFGGEWYWNNLQCKLMLNRGSKTGITIRYGKNLVDIKQEESIESFYTAVMPYVVDNDGNAVLGDLQTIVSTDEPKIYNLDLSDKFDVGESVPTKAQINQSARSYIESNELNAPKVNIDISFIALWQTENYKNIAPLERVRLCDEISVYFEKLGISATAKVIETDYDVLNERYNQITIGNARSSFSNTVASVVGKSATEVKSSMTDAIASATKLLSGGLGGHVVIGKNSAGQPNEVLIMDTDDKATATNVIRMNMSGIGFSQSGYNGPFGSAWTIDGKFNADFIQAGKIKAIDIEGSVISGSTFVFSKDATSPLKIVGGKYSIYDYVDHETKEIYGAIALSLDDGSTSSFMIKSAYAFSSSVYPAYIQVLNDHRLAINFGSLKRSIDNRVTVQAGEGMAGLYIANDTTASNYIGLFDNGGMNIITSNSMLMQSKDNMTLISTDGVAHIDGKDNMVLKSSGGAVNITADAGAVNLTGSGRLYMRSTASDVYIQSATKTTIQAGSGLTLYIGGSGYNLEFFSTGDGHVYLGKS